LIKAARLLGAAEFFQIASGVCAEPAERAEHDHLVASIRNQLGEAAFATAWAEGRAHSKEQAELTETFRAPERVGHPFSET
jgi:hypothetical protein